MKPSPDLVIDMLEMKQDLYTLILKWEKEGKEYIDVFSLFIAASIRITAGSSLPMEQVEVVFKDFFSCNIMESAMREVKDLRENLAKN